MKSAIQFLLFTLALNPIFSQLEWANTLGGTNNDFGTSIKVDNNDNIILAGHFRATVDFDFGPGTANRVSNGGDDLFVAKYDQNENLIWAISMGGANGDQINDIALDNNGDIYITGRFQSSSIDMDPGPGTANIFANSATNQWDIFVAKYSANGDFIWAFAYGTANIAEAGNGIDIDNNGNVYVTGIFRDPIDFDPGAGIATLTPNSNGDVFVAKYTTNGDYVWAFNLGASGFNTSTGQTLRADNQGYIYVGGNFEGTVDFDPGPGNTSLTSGFITDGFVAKYSVNGDFEWVVGLINSNQNRVHTIDMDPVSGDIFVGGSFQGTVDFDPIGTGNNLSSPTGSSPYIARYNSNGTLSWVRQFSGSSSATRSVSYDQNNVLWCTGEFSNTMDFDFPNNFELTSAGSTDIFYGRYDANNGSFLCVEGIGSTGLDQGSAIAFINGNTAVYTGYFQGTVDFDPGAGTQSFTASGNYDIPFIKVNDVCPANAPQLAAIFTASETEICVGDTILFTDNSTGAVTTWSWDFDGANPASQNSQGPHEVVFNNPGTFSISLEVSDGSDTETETLNITVNALPIVDAGLDQTICFGDTVILNATGADDYAWDNGLGAGALQEVSPTLTTTYIVTGTVLATGCINSDEVEVTVNPLPVIELIVDTEVCEGGILNFTETNAYSSYNWTGPDNFSSTDQSPSIANAQSINEGWYFLQVEDANNCTKSDSTFVQVLSTATGTDLQVACEAFTWIDGVTYTSSTNNTSFTLTGGAANGCDSIVSLDLTIIPKPNVTASSNSPICEGDSLILNSTGSSGGTFSWTGPIGFQSAAQNPSIANANINQSGTYEVVITTGQNCHDTATVEVNIFTPEYNLFAIDDSCQNALGQIIIEPINPNSDYSFEWNNGSDEQTLSNLNAGNYSVIITDEAGCLAFEEVQIFNLTDDCDCFVYVANAFSPNGDNNNDEIFVRGECIQSLSFKIFNRWGNMVFETNQLLNGWDGKYKGELQNSGVYVYMLEVQFNNGESAKENGNITLIR